MMKELENITLISIEICIGSAEIVFQFFDPTRVQVYFNILLYIYF